MKMKKKSLQKVLSCLFFIALYCCVGFCEDKANRPKANDVFTVGDHRDIEVARPKPGFIGGPIRLVGVDHPPLLPPTWDKDFGKKYVRVTVLDKVRLKKSTLVCLRVDRTNADGTALKDPRSYYAYVDVKPEGCRITGKNSPIEKNRDGGMPWRVEKMEYHLYETWAGSGGPFVLLLTCPPAFSPDRTLKESSRISDYNGVVYTESTKVADGRRIRAALIEKVQASRKVKPEDIRHYSDKDKMLRDKENADSIKVTIRCQETQIWAKPNDWLWETMERTDSEGHILMRCRQRTYK